jgi:hypothetical protein
VGRFSKHLGQVQDVTIEYADGTNEVLKLKPLGWEDVNDLILIGKDFGESGSNVLEKMTNETIERMKNIVLKTMKISYPEDPEDELKEFCAKNFIQLIPIILDLNFNVGKADKLEKIKKLQANASARTVQPVKV